MPWFRTPPPTATPLTSTNLREVLVDVLQPRHFFTGPRTRLEWDGPRVEEVPWELFHGRLLDVPMTRQQRTFESWNIFLVDESGRSSEPLLALKLDAAAGELHVVRAVLCYAWEPYAEGNVILSRETRRWVRELVGTVRLEQFGTVEELRDELICLLFQAVVGTSRLPLTSVEAPLPAFSFGELAYCYAKKVPGTFFGRGADPALNERERAKLLETLLHATPSADLPAVADTFPTSPLDVLRMLFNEVSLSPYTDLVDKALAWLNLLHRQQRITAAELADFLTRLLRLIGRHLTAFDLVTFHHRGANYPDALLLDAVLKAAFTLAREHPELFQGDGPARRRRRGLRQGWLLRCRYEGLPVPDLPTSQGENLRVLPEPFHRIPDEQILLPHRRGRQLFAGDPLADWLTPGDRVLLRQALADLAQPAELRELGMALFLDRPLGAAKHPLEPDLTPLLSYEAFSRSLAERRLDFLTLELKALSTEEAASLRQALAASPGEVGVPIRTVANQPRPGTVSLADACQVADDFVLLRTTASSAREFYRLFPLEPLRPWLAAGKPALVLGLASPRPGEVVLTVQDDQGRKRLELVGDTSRGYVRRGGVEIPAGGLRVATSSPAP
jgi:hypothetical protein